MRVRSTVLLAAATAASCAGGARRSPAPRNAPVATPPHAAPAATPTTLPDAAELLASLAITGASWETALAEVPAGRARAVAIELLREGRLECGNLVEEYLGCGSVEQSFAPVPAGATLDDPCLRRHVAGWALSRLEATDVPAVADALAAIVALPRPEQELIDQVIALMPTGEDELRLRLIAAAAAAGRTDVADALVPGLSPAGAAHALVELGRESAVAHLGATPRVGTLAAALERGVSPPTAHLILDRLTPDDLAEPAVAAAVRNVVTGGECEVAAAAALLFDAAGDPQYLPSRTALPDELAATRALCVARHVSALEARAVLETLVSRDGLDLVTVERRYWFDGEPDPDLDGDSDPHTRTTRAHVTRADLDADTLLDWLPASCEGHSCVGHTGAVTMSFTRTPRGGLAIEEISVEHVEEGCGC